MTDLAIKLRKTHEDYQIAQLASMGASVEEICALLNLEPQRVRKSITTQVRNLTALAKRDTERLKEVQVQRYEDLIDANWRAATETILHGPSVAHANLVLSAMAQMSKALGLDAPDRKEIVQTTTINGRVDLAAVPTERLVEAQARIKAKLALVAGDDYKEAETDDAASDDT